MIATIHGDIKAAKRHAAEINRLLKKTNFSDSIYQIKIEPAYNENGQFYDMLMAPELDSKNLDNDGFEGQLSLGEDSFYQKYEAKIKLLTDKFMPVRDDDERVLEQHRREMEQYADYRNYLSFSMYEQVTDADGNVIRENFVDAMAGRDSGGVSIYPVSDCAVSVMIIGIHVAGPEIAVFHNTVPVFPDGGSSFCDWIQPGWIFSSKK